MPSFASPTPPQAPYLALAVLVQAGLDGVRRRLEIETQNPPALPASLEDALTAARSERDRPPIGWGAEFLSAYLKFKRAEIKGLDNLDENEICRRYAEVY